jgi:hypothetical protein
MLSHYSAEPLGELRSVPEQTPMSPSLGWSFGDKPRGLWVSVDGHDDWAEWCISNGWHLEGLEHRHVIVLKEPSNLLWLTDPGAIRTFQEHFSADDTGFGFPSYHLRAMSMFHVIDWSRVAAQYAGIVIAPYQPRLRYDLMWYYFWDCASGCIWDTSIIARIERANDGGSMQP